MAEIEGNKKKKKTKKNNTTLAVASGDQCLTSPTTRGKQQYTTDACTAFRQTRPTCAASQQSAPDEVATWPKAKKK